MKFQLLYLSKYHSPSNTTHITNFYCVFQGRKMRIKCKNQIYYLIESDTKSQNVMINMCSTLYYHIKALNMICTWFLMRKL